MKKLFTLFLTGLLLMSCHDSVQNYSEQEVKEIQYEQAFEKAFGKISPFIYPFLKKSPSIQLYRRNNNQTGGSGYYFNDLVFLTLSGSELKIY